MRIQCCKYDFLPGYDFCLTCVPDGDFRTPKLNALTPNMRVPPTRYAVSLPAHQNSVQKTIGPKARPNCPQLLKAPSTSPLLLSLASKLPRLFSPVTTVAEVIDNRAPAPYSPPDVWTLARRKNASAHDTMPMRTIRSEGRRRTMEPCSMDETRPMKPSSRPLSFEGDGWSGKRAEVMRNGRENSSPENGRRKSRCVMLSSHGAFVWTIALFSSACCFFDVEPLALDLASGRVSGRYRYR